MAHGTPVGFLIYRADFSDCSGFSVLAGMSEQQLFYTVQQIAERWQCDAEKVSRIFQNDPAVMNLGAAADKRRRKRAYKILRIPTTALARVERELTAK